MGREDIGSEPLAGLNLVGRLGPSQFLELAIALTEHIDQLHQHQMICNTLYPGTILLSNPGPGYFQWIYQSKTSS